MLTEETLGQPVVRFEKAHGLTGIRGRYIFPMTPGMDRLSLQKKIFPTSGEEFVLWGSPDVGILSRSELESVFNELKKHNAGEIEKIRFNPLVTEELRDAVHGIVSGFNPEDISLFIRRVHGDMPEGSALRTAEEVERKKAHTIKIMQRLDKGASMKWVPSQPTLENIWQQVKERPVITTLEEAATTVRNNTAGWLIGLGIAAVGSYVLWQRSEKQKDAIIKAASDRIASDGVAPGHVSAYRNETRNAPVTGV